MVTGTPRIEMEFCADFGSMAREVRTSMTVEGEMTSSESMLTEMCSLMSHAPVRRA
jgi:hypothetical protein